MAATPIRAVPVAFAGCLGWFHAPAAGAALARGVVLCAPEGHEALTTHRGQRDLAERCAAAGLPTLRFDYPGCGDSPDGDATGMLDAARRAIGDAIGWMHAEAGVAEVALCGLRLGALLATEAAAARPGAIAALALLAPVASGKAHRRQMLLAARIADATAEEARDIEVAGHPWPEAELDALARADLGRSFVAARVPRTLVVERRPALAQRLGGAVTALPFAGHEAFFTPAHASVIPADTFARVVDWLAESAPHDDAPRQVAGFPSIDIGGGATERVLRLGATGGMVGVHCAPPSTARRTAVLMVNTGANGRVGVGRFGVRLARHLAGLGIASLRMDLPGIGDSDAPAWLDNPDGVPDLFHDALADSAAAGLDHLAASGAARCLVVGICSGAHVALGLALRDRRVDALALFNLPAFDRSQGGAPTLDGGPPAGERGLLRRPRMAFRRLRAELDHLLATHFGIEANLDRPGRWMRDLAARRAQVLLAYSRGDRGLRELRAHFGRHGRRLATLPLLRFRQLDGTDHSLAPRAMQAEALRLVEQEALRLDTAIMAAPRAATESPAAMPGFVMPLTQGGGR